MLYNRRRPTCEHCGGAVPEGLRLGAAEVDKLDRIRDEDAARHKVSIQTLKARPGGLLNDAGGWADFDLGGDAGDCGGGGDC